MTSYTENGNFLKNLNNMTLETQNVRASPPCCRKAGSRKAL